MFKFSKFSVLIESVLMFRPSTMFVLVARDSSSRYPVTAPVEKKACLARFLQDNHEKCKSCKILTEKANLARI